MVGLSHMTQTKRNKKMAVYNKEAGNAYRQSEKYKRIKAEREARKKFTIIQTVNPRDPKSTQGFYREMNVAV